LNVIAFGFERDAHRSQNIPVVIDQSNGRHLPLFLLTCPAFPACLVSTVTLVPDLSHGIPRTQNAAQRGEEA
jgi:hypothetical protein